MLTPQDSGIVSRIRLQDIKSTDTESYALRIHGYFDIEHEGNYTFYAASNDGSQVLVDNYRVVDNDGSHGLQERSGNLYLEAGKHLLNVFYFQRGGAQDLHIYFKGPELEKQEIMPIE